MLIQLTVFETHTNCLRDIVTSVATSFLSEQMLERRPCVCTACCGSGFHYVQKNTIELIVWGLPHPGSHCVLIVRRDQYALLTISGEGI